MKKIEYMAPEMEVIKLKMKMNVLLDTSGGEINDPNNPEEI